MAGSLIRAGLLSILAAGPLHAVCCPFPPIGGDIASFGQTNLVAFDAAADRATVIPNVGLVGQGTTFSLIVPTPTEPALEAVSGTIWNEARNLLTPATGRARGSDEGFGCSCRQTQEIVTADAPPEPDLENGGVVIVSMETVGAFDATILTATSATALVDWLAANDFAYSPDDSAAFAPYITRSWYFTAMRLDSALVELPPDEWNVSLDPVAITFDTETFEVPLPILAVNREPRFPVTFLVVARERMTLDGFRTRYANRISGSELGAIRERAPTVAEYIGEGDFLVQLTRTFVPDDPMAGSIQLVRSQETGEVYPGFPRRGSLGVAPLVLGLGAVAMRLMARRRRSGRAP